MVAVGARALLGLLPWPWTGKLAVLPAPHLLGRVEGCSVQDPSAIHS